MPLVGAQLGSGFPSRAWGMQLPLPTALPTPPATPELPRCLGAPPLSGCKARWGAGGSAQIHTYILTHAGHVCTHNHTESLTVTCTLWTKAHSSHVSPWPLSKHRHALPFTAPGLLNCPLLFPVHLSGRGRGGREGARQGGVSVPGATEDIPCLGRITEAASFQEPEPAVLTPCPVPEGRTAGLSAHGISVWLDSRKDAPSVFVWSCRWYPHPGVQSQLRLAV